MPRFIITANYTAEALKGMLAKPADREAAVKPFVEAAGGTLVDYYVTTGPKDFMMIVDGDDVSDLIAGLMVSGAAGIIANPETIRAFNANEFTATQKKAQALASKANPPGS